MPISFPYSVAAKLSHLSLAASLRPHSKSPFLSIQSVIVCLLVLGCLAQDAVADTLYLKDKRALKGVIVEQQADHYLVNTLEGEVKVPKAQVESAVYDDPEQSYFQLGRQLQQEGKLREAVVAYRRAWEIKPDFWAAREAMFTAQRLIQGSRQSELYDEVKRKRMLMEQASRGARKGPKKDQVVVPKPPKTVSERIGCQFGYEKGRTIVARLDPNGAATRAGLAVGDVVTSVWGEPIKGMAIEVVIQKLSTVEGEVLLAVEREVALESSGDDQREFVFDLGYEGLRIGEMKPAVWNRALRRGDLVLSINGNPARYLTIEEAQKAMSGGGVVKVTVRRTIPVLAWEN